MDKIKKNLQTLIKELKKVNINDRNFMASDECCLEVMELQSEIKRIMNDFTNVLDETHSMSQKLNDAYQIIEKSPVVVFHWTLHEDIPTKYVSSNVSQYGYCPDDFYTGHMKDYWDLIHEDDRSEAKQRVYDAREKGTSEFQHQYRVVNSYGDTKWVEEHTFIEYDQSGEPVSEKGILYDITELKLMEERIIHNENRYRNLFEKAPAIMMTLDLKGHITSLK